MNQQEVKEVARIATKAAIDYVRATEPYPSMVDGAQAAELKGMSYKTFKKRYIDTGKIAYHEGKFKTAEVHAL